MRSWVRLLSFLWRATRPAATRWPSPVTCWPSTLSVNANCRKRWIISSPDMWVRLFTNMQIYVLTNANLKLSFGSGVARLYQRPGAEVFRHGDKWNPPLVSPRIQVKRVDLLSMTGCDPCSCNIPFHCTKVCEKRWAWLCGERTVIPKRSFAGDSSRFPSSWPGTLARSWQVHPWEVRKAAHSYSSCSKLADRPLAGLYLIS